MLPKFKKEKKPEENKEEELPDGDPVLGRRIFQF